MVNFRTGQNWKTFCTRKSLIGYIDVQRVSLYTVCLNVFSILDFSLYVYAAATDNEKYSWETAFM